MILKKSCDIAGHLHLAENRLPVFLGMALLLALLGIAYRFRAPLETTIPFVLAPTHTLRQLYPTGSGYMAVTTTPSGDYFIQTEKQTRGPFRSLGVTSDKLGLTQTKPQPVVSLRDIRFFTRLRWPGDSVFACRQKGKWYVKEGRHLVGSYLKVKSLTLDPARAQVLAVVTGPSGDYRLIDRKTKGPYPEVLPLFAWSPDSRDLAFVTRRGQRYFVRTQKRTWGPYEAVREIRWSATGYDLAVLAKDAGQWWIFSDWGRFGPMPPSIHALQVWPQKSRLSFATLDGRTLTTHFWWNRKPFIGSIITDPRGLPAGSVYYDPRKHVVVRMR